MSQFDNTRLLISCLILLVCSIVYGCTPVIQKEYITVQLKSEPRPVLPKIASEELMCLSQDTYQKLYDRQRLITGYAITLESIISSTNKPTGDK